MRATHSDLPDRRVRDRNTVIVTVVVIEPYKFGFSVASIIFFKYFLVKKLLI